MASNTCEIHFGDIGTVFRLLIVDCTSVPVDLSTATLLEMIFIKPDQTTVTQTGVAYTNGSDHGVDYTTIASDLDQNGGWRVQAKVTLPTGTWYSSIQNFTVFPNLA